MGPGSGSDYVAKFAIPIMKRHGTVRNAISNLFIDEKVVSVNYEVSDPVFDLIFSDDPSVVALDTHHPSSPPPLPPTPGLLQHMRHHHVHVHVQCTTLDRGAHVRHLRPHRRYRRLHEPLRRLRLRRLQGGCVERRGGSDGTRIFTRGETGREAPHEHESKGSDAPAVPKARAWTGMFGSGAPAVPKARA